MIRAKRYIPIARPIAMCIPQMQISQMFRVLLSQIKNGYPVSRIQMKTPAIGNAFQIASDETINSSRQQVIPVVL